MQRYSRQMLLPEIGRTGQILLQHSKVLIIGAGGIGSTCAMYLAGSGIAIDILDFDMVETTNLHRQIIHDESKNGINKAISAIERLKLINSTLEYKALTCKLTATNAIEIITNYELIIDATDNIESRYLINDCCVILNKPLVSGSAVSMDGQITVILPHITPCYRCIYPTVRQGSGCRSCADAGVLGPIPGMIGCLQAIEAMKVLLNKDIYLPIPATTSVDIKDQEEYEVSLSYVTSATNKAKRLKPLLGRQVFYDGLQGDFHTFELPTRNLNCAVCGINPTITTMQHSEATLIQSSPSKQLQSPQSKSSPQPSQSQVQLQLHSEMASVSDTKNSLNVKVIENENNILQRQTVSIKEYANIINQSTTTTTNNNIVIPHLLIDVRSSEQFSITNLILPNMHVFSSIDSCLEALKQLHDVSITIPQKTTSMIPPINVIQSPTMLHHSNYISSSSSSSSNIQHSQQQQQQQQQQQLCKDMSLSSSIQVNIPLELLEGGRLSTTKQSIQTNTIQNILEIYQLFIKHLTITSNNNDNNFVNNNNNNFKVPVYIICRRGIASLKALHILQSYLLNNHLTNVPDNLSDDKSSDLDKKNITFDINNIYHIEGGLTAWSKEIDLNFEMY